MISVTIYNPSQSEFEQLQARYSNTLVCPCRNIVIPYESFIGITPIVHPICSSGFITNEWLLYTTNTIDRSNLITSDYALSTFYIKELDFYVVSSGQFQALQNLCSRAQNTVELNLKIFANTSFISDTAKTKQFVNSYVEEAVTRMINSAANEFLRDLDIISGIIQVEQIVDRLQKNYLINVPLDNDGNIEYNKTILTYHQSPVYKQVVSGVLTSLSCDCKYSMDCGTIMIISDKDSYYGISDVYYVLPNFYSGCYFVQALLSSSLICFFDVDCVDIISSAYVSYESLPTNIKPLDESKLFASTKNATVLELTNTIFVEKWNSTVNYSGFYSACSPLSCTYNYIDHHSFLYILSETLSLIGGLVTILSILVYTITRFIMHRLVKNNTESDVVNEQATTTRIRWTHNLWKMIVNKLSTINIFEDSMDIDDDRLTEYELKNSRIATRLYIFLLISIVVITSFILRITKETIIISVENPTRADYEKLLLKQEAINLNCRCTNIAVSYNQTMKLEPIYHPLCYSQYAESWKILLETYSNIDVFETNYNFRQRFFSQMWLAKHLCLLAENKIINSLIDFYATSFVSTQLLPIDLLTVQAQSLSNIFIEHLAADFILTIDTMNAIVQNDQLFSADFISRELFISSPDTMKVLSRPTIYDNCNCDNFNQSSCEVTTIFISIHNDGLNVTRELIPGIIAGCNQVDSLKKSNLALFFNQTFIDTIINKLNVYEPTIIQALNASQLGIIHQINTSIGELLADLFVEDWQLKVLFDEYFKGCAPVSCSYQIIEYHNYIYIITFIFGLIGGLATALRLFLLPLVRFLRRKHKPSRIISVIEQSLFIRLKILILTLNIFSKKTETNVYKRQNGILATRFYIIILVLSLVTLGLFNGLTPHITSITFINPSEKEFNLLYSQYSDTLHCPCSIEYFPYQSFIKLYPKLHPICTNTLLNEISNNIIISQLSLTFLRSLHDLCQLANRTINQSLNQFLLTQYISAILISSDSLNSRVQVFIDELITKTSNNFIQKLDATTNYIQSNQLLTTSMTNFNILISNKTYIFTASIQTRTYENEECDCLTNTSCSEDYLELPGFYIGCYITNALRQSNLNCFFDKLCMISTFNLNKTLSNEENNSLIMSMNELINKVFVITWGISKLNYTDYFLACQPISCTYLYNGRRHLLLVITIIIGIFGGLSNLLRILMPMIVTLVRKIYWKRRQRFIQAFIQ